MVIEAGGDVKFPGGKRASPQEYFVIKWKKLGNGGDSHGKPGETLHRPGAGPVPAGPAGPGLRPGGTGLPPVPHRRRGQGRGRGGPDPHLRRQPGGGGCLSGLGGVRRRPLRVPAGAGVRRPPVRGDHHRGLFRPGGHGLHRLSPRGRPLPAGGIPDLPLPPAGGRGPGGGGILRLRVPDRGPAAPVPGPRHRPVPLLPGAGAA